MLRKQEKKGGGQARREERESMRRHKYISNQLSIRKAHAGNQHSSCSVKRLGTEPPLWELFSCLLHTSLCFKAAWKSYTESFLAGNLCPWPLSLSLSCQDGIYFEIKDVFSAAVKPCRCSLSLFSFHKNLQFFSPYRKLIILFFPCFPSCTSLFWWVQIHNHRSGKRCGWKAIYSCLTLNLLRVPIKEINQY